MDAYRSWNAGGRGGRLDSDLDGALGGLGWVPGSSRLRRLAGGADSASEFSLSEPPEDDDE